MPRQQTFEVPASQLDAEFGAAWDGLASQKPQFTPSFCDVIAARAEPASTLRVIGVRQGAWIVAISIFVVTETTREFWLGEQPVASLRLRTAHLFGSTSLGSADDSAAIAVLKRIAGDTKIDLLTFRDVPQSDFLYRVVKQGLWKGPRRISHHRATRRLAVLPDTMAEYWATLRPSTRKAGLRDLKMFERLSPVYETFTDLIEVNDFVARASELSAKTYQSKLGVGLVDTNEFREHLKWLSSRGAFRGYISTVGGRDVGFVWGDISHGVMYFRTTGFDPAMSRVSPGKAIVLYVINDLIRTKAAHTFDFSGRDMDFKERFSTSSIDCADFVLSRWGSLRGVAAIGLETLFAVPKQIVLFLLNAERIQQLRKLLRDLR